MRRNLLLDLFGNSRFDSQVQAVFRALLVTTAWKDLRSLSGYFSTNAILLKQRVSIRFIVYAEISLQQHEGRSVRRVLTVP